MNLYWWKIRLSLLSEIWDKSIRQAEAVLNIQSTPIQAHNNIPAQMAAVVVLLVLLGHLLDQNLFYSILPTSKAWKVSNSCQTSNFSIIPLLASSVKKQVLRSSKNNIRNQTSLLMGHPSNSTVPHLAEKVLLFKIHFRLELVSRWEYRLEPIFKVFQLQMPTEKNPPRSLLPASKIDFKRQRTCLIKMENEIMWEFFYK